jgi:ketosteroid isomerase-like protein
MVVPEWSAATVIHAVYDAWADGDADTFVKLYTDDATVVRRPSTRRRTTTTSGSVYQNDIVQGCRAARSGRHCLLRARHQSRKQPG